MSLPQIDFLIPGLLGPFPEGFKAPRLPALETLLARADRVDGTGADLASTLFSLFGISTPADADLPIGPICLLADNLPQVLKPAGGYTLLATPVHLRPDQDRLLLFPAAEIGITQAEADDLVASFNVHFADRGLRLIAPQPGRWYLLADEPPQLRTTPLEAVAGRNVARALPEGPDGRRWHVLLNEIQMLFHQAPLNDGREAQGAPAINGLWLHGGGFLPDAIPAPYAGVWGDHPLARGLARLAGVELHPLADWRPRLGAEVRPPGPRGGLPSSSGATAPGRHLVVLDSLAIAQGQGDQASWTEQAHRIDQTLVAPLLRDLRREAIGRIDLYPCNGARYSLERRGLWCIWRRPRPLVG